MADTMTLKDGKWNFSKFQFYEYIASGKELVKIADDKTISEVIVSDTEMVSNEFYTDNTKENIEKYNKGEYVFAYVKADKLYYGYIMKGMLEFIGDTEGPTDPTDPDFSQTEYEKNIKSQTEYVENNNFKLSKAFTEINTELKKDDDLIANDLFDIDKKIVEIKSIRSKIFKLNGDRNGVDYEYKIDEVNVNNNKRKYLYLDFVGKEIDTFQVAFKYNGSRSVTFSGDNFNWDDRGVIYHIGSYYKVDEKFYRENSIVSDDDIISFLNKVYDGVKIGRVYIHNSYNSRVSKLQIYSLTVTYK